MIIWAIRGQGPRVGVYESSRWGSFSGVFSFWVSGLGLLGLRG